MAKSEKEGVTFRIAMSDMKIFFKYHNLCDKECEGWAMTLFSFLGIMYLLFNIEQQKYDFY